MTSFNSYPKIYNVGHVALKDFFLSGTTIIEEKVDGSQISFGRFDNLIRMRSKGCQIDIDAPPKMFELAAKNIIDRFDLLKDGWTYRGEYLAKPKHNTLAYDRVPKDNIIIFDVATGEEDYFGCAAKALEAESIGFEAVQFMGAFCGVPTMEQLQSLLDTTSVLGGQKIEGFVLKKLDPIFGVDKKPLIAKFVSDSFKEIHGKDWKDRHPAGGDIIALLKDSFRTPARWNKAIQHLQEAGSIEGSMRDIGPLLKEIASDTKLECEAEIKDALFKWAWPQIHRGLTKGFPEYYKEKLAVESLT